MVRRLIVLLGLLVVVWLVGCFFLFVRPSAETGAPRHADAIIMLSGNENRLPEALRLARAGVAPVLALSSIQLSPGWHAATHLCAADHYGRTRVLCFPAIPYSTRGEARAVTRMAEQRHWNSVVVVSSTYHLTRARLLFRRCWNGRLSFVGVPDAWWQLPWDWASETGKLLVQETVARSC